VGGDERFYAILHEQHGYPGWRWDYDCAVEQAFKQHEPGHVLDVGAGTGIFLRSLSGRWKRYAVEGSEVTREILRSQGIIVFSSLAEARASKISFDIITMFQVLEHIAEFRLTLRDCRELLRAGGTLFITVPDADAMERQEIYTGCADMPPNHVNKWTPKSLMLALEQVGFAAKGSWYQPRSFATVRNVLHLRILADRRVAGSLAERVYRISSKRFRVMLLALLAVPTFFKVAPRLLRLSRGGAFGLVAE
jgi:SAM-dependent methyltransferase